MDKTKLAEENAQGEQEGIKLNKKIEIGLIDNCLKLSFSALHGRDFDPEEFLISMGFGGSDSSMQRIPQRFVQQQSQARGVTVEAFLETQRKIVNRFESGYSGYKGLAGTCYILKYLLIFIIRKFGFTPLPGCGEHFAVNENHKP